MKKRFFLVAELMILCLAVEAQVVLQPSIPSVGLVQKSQLWNVLLINNTQAVHSCHLQLTLRDRTSGQEILTATTNQFNIETGAKQLNVTTLNPVQYNYISGSINSLQTILPAGNYVACYTLTSFSVKEGDLAQECISFDIEALSPPMLIFPADSSLLETAPAQFSWMPPTPVEMFEKLQYDILITEIKEGQKANEALQQNVSFYYNSGLYTNFLNYPSAAISFEKNKWYAWQIIARDGKNYAGKSETWVFKINTPSITKTIIEQTPFIKMRKDKVEKGIALNGILKLYYVNETADSVATIEIIDLNHQNKEVLQFAILLRPGENFIEYDLKKLLIIKEGNVYEAQFINSRKEKWLMQFQVYKYEDKKEVKN